MTRGMWLLQPKTAKSWTAIAPLETSRPHPLNPRPPIHSPRCFRGPTAALNGLLLLMVLVITAGAPLGLNLSAAWAAEESGKADTKRVLDFQEAVRIALQQSPYFAKSALDIELSRLDESDSRYGFLPQGSFRP